jgi:hypothetical protein
MPRDWLPWFVVSVRASRSVCENYSRGVKLTSIEVYDMLRFAQDLRECRKIQFAKSASGNVSMDL